MVTPQSFKLFLPEFEPVEDGRVQMYLDATALQLNMRVWREKYDLGQTYLTAHMLTMDTQPGQGSPSAGSIRALGSVTNESVGQVSRGYAPIWAGASDLNSITDLASTKYGVAFSRIKRTLIKTPMVC